MLADRVRQTSHTMGTGPYTLDGPVPGFRSFVAGIGDGQPCYYVAVYAELWEVGTGTVQAGPPDQLTRDTLLTSTTGVWIDWPAGVKDLAVTVPAAFLLEGGAGPEWTWVGDQIAINGVVEGPHLTGPEGPAGADGAPGADGADGAPGADGADGAPGADGADGRTVLSGSGTPASGLGADGDFFIDTTAWVIYGPKTAGAWGSGTSLIGPPGSGGGATGAKSDPWPADALMWRTVSHRKGIAGNPVVYVGSEIADVGIGQSPASSKSIVFTSTAISGKYGINYGGDNYLSLPIGIPTNAGFTALFVIKTPSSFSTSAISSILCGVENSLQISLAEMSSGQSYINLVATAVVNIGGDSEAGAIPASTLLLVSVTVSAAGAWTIRRNGVQTASGSGGTVPNSINRIGGRSGSPPESPKHELYEMVLFGSVLGSSDLAAAESYLMTKWEI